MSASLARALSILVAVLLVAASLGGCTTTVEYHDDDDDGSGGTGGTGGTGGSPVGVVPAPGEADGSFFLALALVLYPPTPIVFEATLLTSEGPAGLELTMDLQPLANGPSGPNDRETPVGNPLSLGGPYSVAGDGTFTLAPPTLDLPGEANPISGNPMAVDITLTGQILTPASFICGDVDGVTVEPPGINISGSTFAMERIASPGPPYPEPPTINCAGDLAQPL